MKRPLVWGFAGLISLFLVALFLFDTPWEKAKKPFSITSEDKIPVHATGILERTEKKPNSCYLYFRSMEIFFEQTLRSTDRSEHKQIPKHFHTEKMLVISDSKYEPLFLPGNHIEISGMLSTFEKQRNPGMFDEEEYYKEKNIDYKITADTLFLKKQTSWYFRNLLLQLRTKLSKVYETCLSEEDSGIINAMLLGEKSSLDLEVRDLYRLNGIGHLLAISGLHIAILCTAFYKSLYALRFPNFLSFLLTVCFLLCYGFMTGFSISTSRAIIMMILFLFSKQIGRSYDSLTAMAVSACFIWFLTPRALFSTGFLLSFSAVGAAVFVFPVFHGIFSGTLYEQEKKKHLENKTRNEQKTKFSFLKFLFFQGMFHLKHMLLSTFLCSLSIIIVTLPVLTFFYYEIPIYSVFLNTIILPFSSLLVMFAAAGGILGLLFLPLAKLVFIPVHLILRLYERCCRFFLHLPQAVYITGCPSFFQITFYALILLLLFIVFWKKIYEQETFSIKERSLFFCILILSVSVLLYRPPIHGISYTLLDVGQGDGMILQTESGHTILIDGGSSSVTKVGTYRILPCLKYYGIRRIDLMIMTHEDDDHISGQLELLETLKQNGLSISSCVLPEPSQNSIGENYQKMINMARLSKIPIQMIHAGDNITLGEVKLFCLHPEKDFPADSKNAYSTTLLLHYQKFSMLLTGDLEKNGEDVVLECLRSLKQTHFPEGITVLKAAHHGSKNSTSKEFLQLVSPKLCMISCGKNNRYGHPHNEFLERLNECGCSVLRTDRDGAIFIKSNGITWNSKAFLNDTVNF